MNNLTVDRCAIFCSYCGESFVILNRETNENDFYICSMCRDFENKSKRDIEENSFKNSETLDYCSH